MPTVKAPFAAASVAFSAMVATQKGRFSADPQGRIVLALYGRSD
jgi:hypothetical protein